MEQDWFEVPEICRRTLAGSVWIPSRCFHRIRETGHIGETGFVLQGFRFLDQCVGTFFAIIGGLERWQGQGPASSA
jgi:hypothetical protein